MLTWVLWSEVEVNTGWRCKEGVVLLGRERTSAFLLE